MQTYKRSCSEIRWRVHGSFFPPWVHRSLMPVSKQHCCFYHFNREPFAKTLDTHRLAEPPFLLMTTFLRYQIILINAALQFHWPLSNSEVSPRIWTCVTRLSFSHVRGGSGHETSQSCDCTANLAKHSRYMYLVCKLRARHQNAPPANFAHSPQLTASDMFVS